MADIKILNDLVAVNLDVRIWSARKKLTAQDLGGVNLPPAELASLGSKKIADPAEIAVFTTIRYKAGAYLDRIGIRFLGGWAIPAARADEVADELDKYKKKFLDAKDKFLRNYDDSIDGWMKQNNAWENILKNAVVGSDHVRSRISFEWQMYSVAPPASQTASQALTDQVSNLGKTLFDEISKTVSEIWKSNFEGRNKVLHRSLIHLRAVLDKLRSMSFVDPNAAPAAKILDQALKTLQAKPGSIVGTDLYMIQGVLCMLMDPQLLLRHCQKVIGGATMNSVLDGITDLARPEPEKSETDETEADEDVGADAEMDAESEEEAADTGLGIPSYGLW